ncbi:recombinase family protein [Streptosporangium canum]|uniref:recombinase family protein n=1 Tax=Streptosporangium canum TaxID=324952 RepID=UPI0036C6EE0A
MVIDDDLGKSAASAVGRAGFQRLVAESTLGHVGPVLGIDMSRLARSGRDWYQLLELCALSADTGGVYDPVEYDDRLLLELRRRPSSGPRHGYARSVRTFPVMLITFNSVNWRLCRRVRKRPGELSAGQRSMGTPG